MGGRVGPALGKDLATHQPPGGSHHRPRRTSHPDRHASSQSRPPLEGTAHDTVIGSLPFCPYSDIRLLMGNGHSTAAFAAAPSRDVQPSTTEDDQRAQPRT